MGRTKRIKASAHQAFLLFHNLRRILDRLEESTYSKAAGLSYQQFLILVAVESADPPVTQTTIANRVQRSLNSISLMIDRMEKLRLVTRLRSPIDRRETHISITDEGRVKLEEALAVGRFLTDRLADVFTQVEIQESTRLMTKLRERLMSEVGEEPAAPAVERNIRRRIVEVWDRDVRT